MAMSNQLKAAYHKLGPLLGGQVHDREPPRAEVEETFMSCGEDISDGENFTVTKKRGITKERSKTGRGLKKAILWLLRRLGCSKEDSEVKGGRGAGFKWYNAVKWKKGDNDRKTKVEDDGRSDKKNTSSRYLTS